MAEIRNDIFYGLAASVTTTVTAGTDLVSTAGGLVLPLTSDDMTMGVIELGGSQFIYARGTQNTFIGFESGNDTFTVATAVNNTVLGHQALANLVDGAHNICIGVSAGSSYTTTEASNILINSIGTALDANTIRIGSQGSGAGQQDKAFMAGVYSVTPATAAETALPLVDSAGQLGSLGLMTDGQLVIGKTGAAPTVGVLTSTGSTVTITYVGDNLNLEAGAAVPTSFLCDDTNSAIPALGVLTVTGDLNLNTSVPAASTLQINLEPDITAIDSVTMSAGGALRTGNTAADTLLLQAYDNTSSTYATFATLTANLVPTFDLNTATTIGTEYIYRVNGNNVAVADGGTGQDSYTDGQLLIGKSVGNTIAKGTLTSTGSTVAITYVGDDLNLETGAAVPTSFLTDDTNSAIPSAGVLTLAGGANISTSSATSVATVALDSDLTAIDSVTMSAGGAIRTGDTAANSVLLQAYNNTSSTYTTFATLTANLVPTFDLNTATTIGTEYIYRVGGNNVAVADGGTGQDSYTDGQLLIGKSTGNTLAKGTLTSTGGTVTISYVGDDLNLEAATGETWVTATANTSMAVDTGYITKHATPATQLVYTLPATAAVGTVMRIAGYTAGGWHLEQNASQVVHFGTSSTTVGATGYVESTEDHDAVHMVCVTADTEWVVLSSVGNVLVA